MVEGSRADYGIRRNSIWTFDRLFAHQAVAAIVEFE
jgi:hypothetical protein